MEELDKIRTTPEKYLWDPSPYLTERFTSALGEDSSDFDIDAVTKETIAMKGTPNYYAMLFEVEIRKCIKANSNICSSFALYYIEMIHKTSMIDNLDMLQSLLDHVRFPSATTYNTCMLINTLYKLPLSNEREISISDCIVKALCQRIFVGEPTSWGLTFLLSSLLGNNDNSKINSNSNYFTSKEKELIIKFSSKEPGKN
jgi:hypothetical protein